ncbi:MAG: VOC family protein [Dehalococcoidia bacterium]|nr:VOC family protein [Dehalococcoidia bacterium]
MIKAANRIMFFVSNMRRSQKFYRDVLGLTPTDEHPEYSSYALGKGFAIALYKGRGQTAGTSPVLALEVADMAAARRALQAAKRTIVRDFHEVPGGISLDFKDPDGHVVQLVQFMKPPKKR